ncbi:MAG: hypothetical protein R2744_05150 [Bacteroidales bacterium]
MIHPVTGNRSRFIVWWLIWFITGLGQSVLLYFTCNCGIGPAVTDGMLSALIYSLIAIAVWYPATQLNPGGGNIAVIILNQVLVGALSVSIWLLSVRVLTASIVSEKDAYLEFWNASIYFRTGAGVFIYALVVLSYQVSDDKHREHCQEEHA